MLQTILIITPLESVPLLTGQVGIAIIVILLTRKGRETAVGICVSDLVN